MRLFVAIELAEDVRSTITAVQTELAPVLSAGGGTLRWSRPDQMHVTLAFIGHVETPRAEAIAGVCRERIDMKPFSVAFGGIGVFPPRGAPRVLWLGMVRGAEPLIRLQSLVAERLGAIDVALEGRPFHPHITLARWRVSRPSDARRVHDFEQDGREIPASVSAVTLFESRQSAAGAFYTPVISSALAGAREHPLQ